MKAHAKLSASGSAQWIGCPGSINACQHIKDTSSTFADEGTLAHELADICLSNAKDAETYIGKTLAIELSIPSLITKDMADYVQEYLDYVTSLGVDTHSEVRVDFSL
ncbi:MAG: DUF2800 domain-containing protein, partial [Gammaproteobacteria bacterium]